MKTKFEPRKLNKLNERFLLFLETTPTERLSRNLRGLLLNMLATQQDGYCFNLNDLLVDMINLFDLLDVAGDELE